MVIQEVCQSCNRQDDAPKHHVYVDGTGLFTTKHTTCCAADGCPVCQPPE